MTQAHWAVEVYSYDNPDPQSAVLPPLLPMFEDNISVYTTATGGNSSIVTNIIKQKTGVAPKVIHEGIRGLEFGKSKGSPEGTAVINFSGPIEKDLYPGVWVLISSFIPRGTKTQVLTRFFGQVYEINPQYMTQGSGLVSLGTTINVREWSSSLNMPVRYDLYNIYREQNPTANGLAPASAQIGANASVLSGVGLADTATSPQQLINILANSYNPFEFAHLALALIGCISDSDKLNPIKELGDIKYPDVALTMPALPKLLLKRIGAPAASTGKNPFSTGTAEVLTGVQKGGVYNDGKWNGIFKETSIQDFKNGKLNKNPEDRPAARQLAVLIQQGVPAWQILSQYCDPEFNEVFTDTWYSQQDDGTVVSTPVVVVRDKPFLMKIERDLSNSEQGPAPKFPLTNWTLYDDLPRVRITKDCIVAFNISNTFMNSPNLLRVNYYDHQDKNKIPTAWVHTVGFLAPVFANRERFGGLEYEIKTSYMGQKADFSPEIWFGTAVRWAKAVHSNGYKFSRGTLSIKDNNVPIALGLNVQFQVGKFQIVGHVSALRTYVNVLENGVVDTTTQISLEKIVQGKKDSTALSYIDTNQLARLLHDTPATTSTPTGILGGVLNLLG